MHCTELVEGEDMGRMLALDGGARVIFGNQNQCLCCSKGEIWGTQATPIYSAKFTDSQSDLHGWAFYVVSSPLPAGTAQSRRRVNAAESAQTRV